MKLGIRRCLIAGAVMGALSLFTSANAATLSFSAYNATVPGLELTVDINVDGSMASFEFFNVSTGSSAGSSLARIYFESGLALIGLSNGSVAGGSGVEFSSAYGGPESPPGGNNVGWAGELAAFGAVSPPPHNGVEVGDSLLIVFDYTGTLNDLVDALMDPSGNARIAGHILDCDNDNSCAGMAVVPIPATLPLLVAALGGLGFVRRRIVPELNRLRP